MVAPSPSPTPSSPSRLQTQIDREQGVLDELHERLATLRRRTGDRLAATYRQPVTGTHQSRIERDAFAARDLHRLARLSGVDGSLYFGALTRDDGEHYRIGRVALTDDEHDVVLLDWRAPAARPFYSATAARPEGVLRRRHVRSRRRTVVGVDDDVLQPGPPGSEDDDLVVSAESALLSSLAGHRTGRMSDIVATIQAEQDQIIRSTDTGVLVVQGAPGTGKTVAALHRAAYLLYTHRDRLADRGVLVIGPNATFLHYIGEVLPSLGETGVVLSTVHGLLPEHAESAAAPGPVVAAKGDARMADVLDRAVKELSVVPDHDVELTVDGRTLVVTPELARRARTRGRRTRRPHNEARASVVRELLDDLAHQRAGQERGWFDDDDLAELRAELGAEPAVRAVIDRLWPRRAPEQLVHAVLSDPTVRSRLSRALGPEAAALVVRDPDTDPSDAGTWTQADVPLLDEARALLGDVRAGIVRDDAAQQAARQRAADIEFAQDLLDGIELPVRVTAEDVADRYAGPLQAMTTADRARRDADWTFGHVIVDEAQELTPMAWRMVQRRCPTRSATVVGDIAQAGGVHGAREWSEVMEPFAPGRWRVAELTVNYRTPGAVMDVAARVLDRVRPDARPPRSVRGGGTLWARRTAPQDLVDVVVTEATALAGAVGDGRAAVLLPTPLLAELGAVLEARVPGAVRDTGPGVLGAPVAVLDVAGAKGLEFDAVLVVEPGDLVATGPHGWHDLYVALTRTTEVLGVVSSRELPAPLADLPG